MDLLVPDELDRVANLVCGVTGYSESLTGAQIKQLEETTATNLAQGDVVPVTTQELLEFLSRPRVAAS